MAEIQVDTIPDLRAQPAPTGSATAVCTFGPLSGDKGGGRFVWDPDSIVDNDWGVYIRPSELDPPSPPPAPPPAPLPGRWVRLEYLQTKAVNPCWFGGLGDGNDTSVEFPDEVTYPRDTHALESAWDLVRKHASDSAKQPALFSADLPHLFIPDGKWASGAGLTLHADKPGMAIRGAASGSPNLVDVEVSLERLYCTVKSLTFSSGTDPKPDDAVLKVASAVTLAGGCGWSVIDDLRIQNRAYPIRVTGGATVSGAQVSNVTALSFKDAILLDDSTKSIGVAFNNIFAYGGRRGCSFKWGSGHTFERIRFIGNSEYGMKISGSYGGGVNKTSWESFFNDITLTHNGIDNSARSFNISSIVQADPDDTSMIRVTTFAAHNFAPGLGEVKITGTGIEGYDFDPEADPPNYTSVVSCTETELVLNMTFTDPYTAPEPPEEPAVVNAPGWDLIIQAEDLIQTVRDLWIDGNINTVFVEGGYNISFAGRIPKVQAWHSKGAAGTLQPSRIYYDHSGQGVYGGSDPDSPVRIDVTDTRISGPGSLSGWQELVRSNRGAVNFSASPLHGIEMRTPSKSAALANNMPDKLNSVGAFGDGVMVAAGDQPLDLYAGAAQVMPRSLPLSEPFNLVIMGQSGAVGAGGAPAPDTISARIQIFDNDTKEFKPPHWGSPPLNLAGYNNLLIQVGNLIDKWGIDPGRPIRVFVFAEAGQSITRFTRPTYTDKDGITHTNYDCLWKRLEDNLKAAEVDRIDAFIFDGGEADSTANPTLEPPAQNTAAAYTKYFFGDGSADPLHDPAFKPLIPHLKALQIGGKNVWWPHTCFVHNELGPWQGCHNARNDSIRLIAFQGEPMAASVSKYGTEGAFKVDEPTEVGDHMKSEYYTMVAGRILETILGMWHGHVGEGKYGSRASTGAYAAFGEDLGTLTDATLTPRDDQLANGLTFAVSGTSSTINLADPARSLGTPGIRMTLATGAAVFNCSQPIVANSTTAATQLVFNIPGFYWLAPVGGSWRVIVDPGMISGQFRIASLTGASVPSLFDPHIESGGNAGGATPYAVGDLIYPVGGTYDSQAVLKVNAVTGGVVTAVAMVNGGAYHVHPQTSTNGIENPIPTTTETGKTGAGLTLTFPHIEYAQFPRRTYAILDDILLPNPNGINPNGISPGGLTTGKCRLVNNDTANHWVGVIGGSFLLASGAVVSAIRLEPGQWIDVEPDQPARYRVTSPPLSDANLAAATTSVAAAATVDLGAVKTAKVAVGGGSTITSFGPGINKVRKVRFGGVNTLTNSTTLILPGAANIVTANGDTCEATSDASGNWTVWQYQRASGKALVAPAAADITDATGPGRALLTAASAAAQRTALGLGSIATQSAASVAITGGVIRSDSGTWSAPALAVGDPGTGFYAGGVGVTRWVSPTAPGSSDFIEFQASSTSAYVKVNKTGAGACFNAIGETGITGLVAARYDNASVEAGGVAELRRARGSIGAPLAVSSNDQLGACTFRGYGGSDFVTGAVFDVLCIDSAPNDGAMGSAFRFRCAGVGSTSPTEVARLDATNGLMMFGASNVVIDANRAFHLPSFTVQGGSPTLPAIAQAAGKLVYCSDLGGGPGQLVSDGTNWRRASSGSFATVAFNADFTLTPLLSAEALLHTGTLTADRAVTLATTNAYVGASFKVTRTGSGAFSLSVGGLKNLATNTWCEVVYDGAAWRLSAYGSL